MKTIIYTLGLLATTTMICSAQGKLAEHVFFKHLIGKWHAEGELTGENADTVKLTEDYESRATEEGGFSIEGHRVLNGDKQTFHWLITHNPSTDSYEAVLTTNGDEAGALRFEGHVSEVNLTIDLKAPLGANGSVTVTDAFVGDDKNTIESKVTFIGDAGNITLSGTIIHRRVKGP